MRLTNNMIILNGEDIKKIKLEHCEFCEDLASVKVKIQIEENISETINVCQRHLEDYEGREGVFKPLYD